MQGAVENQKPLAMPPQSRVQILFGAQSKTLDLQGFLNNLPMAPLAALGIGMPSIFLAFARRADIRTCFQET